MRSDWRRCVGPHREVACRLMEIIGPILDFIGIQVCDHILAFDQGSNAPQPGLTMPIPNAACRGLTGGLWIVRIRSLIGRSGGGSAKLCDAIQPMAAGST